MRVWGEPNPFVKRLFFVRKLVLGTVAVVLFLTTTTPVFAEEVLAQSGPSIEATVGIGGFAAAGKPTSVAATISTPVLVSGRLRVQGAGMSVSRPVEVPAGGSQLYEVAFPALENGTRLTVALVDDKDEVLVSEAVVVRSSFDEMAVGVIGDEDLSAVLGRVRTIVTDRPVVPLDVRADSALSTFEVLDYLVVASSEGVEVGMDWARQGGRLVVESDLVESADFGVTPLPTGQTGVATAPLGAGRVVIVADLSSRSADDWAAILRPTPLNLANSPEWGFADAGGGLLQAASESGSRQVPSLPWLLFAILGFALLVGPVNFVVLSKLDRRDWAWVTIPVMALVAVVGFWVAGRQRIAGTNLTHASVVVSDGALRARSAVMVAAGVSGDRRVAFDPAAVVYPERSNFGSAGTELRLDGDNSAILSLDQLGFVGVGVSTTQVDMVLPEVTTSDQTVTVENDSGIVYWGWGVVGAGSTTVSNNDLAARSSDSVPVRDGANEFGFSFIDALMNQRQLWEDPVRANSLWPFSQVLNSVTEEGGRYFVALTDDYRPQVTVDGVDPAVPGTTLVVIRLDDAGADQPGGGLTSVGAEVIGTGFINWLDWSNQRVVATDELTVAFSLPDPTLDVRFQDTIQFGMPATEYLAWDWDQSVFTAVIPGEILGDEMISPDGQVYVRLVGQEFGENPFSPDALTLEWDA